MDHTIRVRFNREFFKVKEGDYEGKNPVRTYYTVGIPESEDVKYECIIIEEFKRGIFFYIVNMEEFVCFYSDTFDLILNRAEKQGYGDNWKAINVIVYELLHHYAIDGYMGSVVEDQCCDLDMCNLSDDVFFNFKDRNLEQDRKEMAEYISAIDLLYVNVKM